MKEHSVDLFQSKMQLELDVGQDHLATQGYYVEGCRCVLSQRCPTEATQSSQFRIHPVAYVGSVTRAKREKELGKTPHKGNGFMA